MALLKPRYCFFPGDRYGLCAATAITQPLSLSLSKASALGSELRTQKGTREKLNSKESHNTYLLSFNED